MTETQALVLYLILGMTFDKSLVRKPTFSALALDKSLVWYVLQSPLKQSSDRTPAHFSWVGTINMMAFMQSIKVCS